MPDVYVLGGDPGKSTGLRLLGPGDQPGIYWQGPADEAGQNILGWLRDVVPAEARLRFAFERFVAGTRSPAGNQSAVVDDVISTARNLARGFGAPFELQAPADAKTAVTNEFLRAVGLWVPTRNGVDADDANDATRHAVLALKRHHATIFATLYKRYRMYRA